MRTSPSPGSRTGPSIREPGELLAVGGDVRVTAWCLPPGTAARRARCLLRSQLEGHVSDLAVLDDLDVIVCELATNARRHTDGPCEMRALHHGGVPVVCEIADCGGGLDRVAAHLRWFAGPDAFVSIEALAE
ncbi:MAG: hypothetical protein ACRDOO_07920, partial [Actinomadura sp.]